MMDFPDKKYSVIYADPPWKFAPMGIDPVKIHQDKATHSAAEGHYSTMGLEDIKALPVADIADKPSVLFMWVTAPFLQKSIEVMEAWGFKYKTVAFVWAKQRDSGKWAHAGGWYTLSQTEHCLLGTRGSKSLTRVNRNVMQLICSPRRKHSQKPDEARERIELIYGDVPRIELFARGRYQGWDVWGDEV